MLLVIIHIYSANIIKLIDDKVPLIFEQVTGRESYYLKFSFNTLNPYNVVTAYLLAAAFFPLAEVFPKLLLTLLK